MIERLLESWLDSASETSFQTPFCQILASQGYRVVHLTRHCGIELGKDIIAEKDSTAYVFQLKSAPGPRITLTDWRQFHGQVFDMVIGAASHPSLSSASRRNPQRAFLVTNRGLDEEVIRQIDDMNRKWQDDGQPQYKLEVLVRGDLLKSAIDLGKNLWPSELGLNDTKTLLELFLANGKGPLPKEKLSELLLAVLPIEATVKPTRQECKRSMFSAALLTAISIFEFSRNDNHTALLDAWGLYASYVLSLAEKWNIHKKDWSPCYALAKMVLKNTLDSLLEELQKREHLIQGDVIHDKHFRGVRINRLLAAISLQVLWDKSSHEEVSQIAFARNFCQKYIGEIDLWGEGAIPSLLLFYWFWRKVDPKADAILFRIANTICKRNHPNAEMKEALPCPYWSESEALEARFLTRDKIDDDFRRQSYGLEGVVQLIAKRMWKVSLRQIWPDVTRILCCHVSVDSFWEWYLWRRTTGVHCAQYFAHTKQWDELLAESNECEGLSVPNLVKEDPLMMALILCILPHRIDPSAVRWLDATMEKMQI